MVRQLEAVYEDGMLRPIEPLSLRQNQRVTLIVDDGAPLAEAGSAEMAWLKANGHRYAGQWVALAGDRLVAHGLDARVVRDEARRQGIAVPLMHRPSESDAEPQAFWI